MESDQTTREMLRVHALNGAQRQSDGASLYAEDSRRSYLTGKDRVSFAEAQAIRHVTESGSGRTRAETNSPDNTAAQRGT